MLIALIVFVSGLIQSITGFGFALIATPLLFLIMDPKIVIAVVILLGTVTMVFLTIVHRNSIIKRRMIFLTIGSLLGIPLGAYLLSIFTPASMKLAVAIIIIAIAISLIPNRSYYFQKDISWHILAGFAGGVLSTSTSLGGPPIVLFLLSQKLKKAEFLGTISAAGLITCIATVIAFGSMGMMSADVFFMAALSLPAMGLGLLLGTRTINLIDNNLFKKVALAVVILSALATMITTLISR